MHKNLPFLHLSGQILNFFKKSYSLLVAHNHNPHLTKSTHSKLNARKIMQTTYQDEVILERFIWIFVFEWRSLFNRQGSRKDPRYMFRVKELCTEQPKKVLMHSKEGYLEQKSAWLSQTSWTSVWCLYQRQEPVEIRFIFDLKFFMFLFRIVENSWLIVRKHSTKWVG